MKHTKPKFSRRKDREFYNTLRTRVNQYFETADVSKFGNSGTVVKMIVLLLLYFVPYLLTVSGLITAPGLVWALWAVMGIGMAGIGMGIMHDANHGSFSKNKKTNNFLGLTLNLLGGNATLWKLQHNVLHHTYTNIDGVDEDIHGRGILRFSPHQELRAIHRFQHIYAWFFYSILTLNWVLQSDYSRVFRYRKLGLIKSDAELRKEFISVVLWKIVYWGYALVLPLLVVPVAPWVIVVSFLTMHLVAGFTLSIIFQTAHVMTTADFPIPAEGSVDNNWAVHQLETTSNYAPNSRVLAWFIGGLNYQIEHHLFAHVSHVHYPEISKIVKHTAEEYGIPYRSYRTFWAALRDHGRMLRQLGTTPRVTPSTVPT
ncbi:MAG: acyl-CoA desaturase [Bacteroidota bacterium]